MSEQKMLVKKLSEVMQGVKYIQKRGINKFHNYSYATESDVAEKVREELAKRCVMLVPNMVSHTIREHENRKGATEYIVTVNMEFTFHDGETGETITFHMAGEGQDAGDKAVYKAITGAQKYALMKVFMIPTGDDPEADTGVDERNAGGDKPQDQKNGANGQQNGNGGQATGSKATDKQLDLINKRLEEVAKVLKITKEEAYAKLKISLATTVDMENFTKDQASAAINILNDAKKQGA